MENFNIKIWSWRISIWKYGHGEF